MQFRDIIGQNELKKKMLQSINENRISHALLFLGPEGCGALPLAMAYIQYIYCKNRTADDSCGECASCKRTSRLLHPDLHIIYPDKATMEKEDILGEGLKQWRNAFLENPYMTLNDWKNIMDSENKQLIIGKEKSHEILHKLYMSSCEGDYKTMIIWMAETMNIAGANKLLKILEEPPDKTLFILVAEEAPEFATILSRTQLVKIPALPTEDITAALIEKNGLDREKAENIALASEGNYRMAQNLLNDTEESKDISEKFQKWMRACIKAEGEALTEVINEIAALNREKQKQLISNALFTLRKVLAMNSGITPHLRDYEKEFVNKISSFLQFNQIDGIVKEINASYYALERNANSKILFMEVSQRVHSLISRQKRAA
jgi:DNA polymerase-3 subunit delta'